MLELLHSSHLIYNILIVVFSGLITLLCIPSILHVARSRHLYDDVGHFRKQHDHGIPRLGGVAIFVSFTITILLFGVIDNALSISYLLISCIILFAMGLKDDLSGVNSSTKFAIQFVVAINTGFAWRYPDNQHVWGVWHYAVALLAKCCIICFAYYAYR
jgi:UDP-GlcNAc:undecaprenyl-phosphate GlcNAc-1-phosphate transferase